MCWLVATVSDLSRSFVKPILSCKLTNTSQIEKSKSESETKLNKNMLSLLLALPPLPLPLSSASPLVLTLLLLDASHGDRPHYWVLVGMGAPRGRRFPTLPSLSGKGEGFPARKNYQNRVEVWVFLQFFVFCLLGKIRPNWTRWVRKK